MNRRTTLRLLAGLPLLGACAARKPGRQTAAMPTGISVVQAAQAIRTGGYSSVELAERLIERVNAFTELGAFIAFDETFLRNKAREADAALARGGAVGPLHGVPIALKDNIDTVDFPTTAGTPSLKDHRPQQNAVVVDRLLSAGAIIGGKTNLHELAGGGTTDNPTFGRTANPYDVQRIPGGSSGGSAVAVAARLMPAALGTDTAGSVRNPCGYCGLSGLRPSTGRVPIQGVVPFALTRDAVGPMATTMEDVVLLDGVMANETAPLEPTRLSDVRLGVPSKPYHDNLSDDVAAAFEEAIGLLTRRGVTFVSAEIADLEAMNDALNLGVTGIEFHRDVAAYLEEHDLGLTVQDVIDGIADTFARPLFMPFRDPTPEMWAEYERVMREVYPRMRQTYRDYLKAHSLDGILFPTTPRTAGIDVPGTADIIWSGERVEGGIWLNVQNGTPTTIWGCGGAVTPLGVDREGLPMSVEIDGWPGEDRRLLSLALAVEETLPGVPPPPLS